MQMGADAELTRRVLVAHGTDPNVYGVVVVGLGCVTMRAQDVAADIQREALTNGCILSSSRTRAAP
jgi:altronate dehydratase large subunit